MKINKQILFIILFIIFFVFIWLFHDNDYLVLPAAIIWIITILWYGGFFSVFERRSLLKNGIPWIGIIKDIKDTQARLNENPIFEILLEIKDPSGETKLIKINQVINLGDLPSLKPETKVNIMIDKDYKKATIVGIL